MYHHEFHKQFIVKVINHHDIGG